MASHDNWRLRGQEDNLKGVILRCKRHTWQQDWNSAWDHDHCAFCWVKFMDANLPDVLRTGYTNTEQVINGKACSDGWLWICPKCFDDFHERFGWIVANEESEMF